MSPWGVASSTVQTTAILDGATMKQASLFGVDGMTAAELLEENHYLGSSTRGDVYRDEHGLMMFANPSSRRLPQQQWLELVRWCILSRQTNAGSRQWAKARLWLLATYPEVSTIVSYSDPAAGHTGALYRACNWLWAPTWHRLRTPPSGNGSWTDGKRQEVKDRWVFPLRVDQRRGELLRVKDEGLRKLMPWAEYREGRGGDYKRWRNQVA